MQTPQPGWCQRHGVHEERLTSRVRKWNWEESGLSFGTHSSCRMDFQTCDHFSSGQFPQQAKQIQCPPGDVAELSKNICMSFVASSNELTTSLALLVTAGGPTEWSKQAVPWSSSWQHAWGKPELSPRVRIGGLMSRGLRTYQTDTEAQALLD